ncbi:MAG: hypothetical protein MUF42_02875 [Cytophagaceae bacterium]|jgi:hypothetical protein|nr:hypothetical protein [Cytophagaceae bacterium]
MKKLLIATIVVLMQSFQLLGQNTTINDIVKFRLSNAGQIMEDNVIKGYYFFYQVDKADNKNYNYIIQIFDENLTSVRKTEITKPKYYYLMEATYNGSAFAFIFLDTKAKITETITYDKSLTNIGTVQSEKLSTMQMSMYGSIASAEESNNSIIFPGGKNNFLMFNSKKEGKIGYSISKVSNKLETKWTIESPDDSKEIQMASYADAKEEIMVSLLAKQKNLFDKDPSYEIMAVSMEDGKILFQNPVVDEKYNLGINSATIDADTKQILVIGDYFELDAKKTKAKSLGYFLKIYDYKGKELKEKFISWESDISKFLPVNKKGKLKADGYIFLHKTIRTADGNYFFIGEQFKKSVDGLGVAMKVINGNNSASAFKIEVMDLMVFQFNKDFDLQKVEIYEKRKSNVSLPAGYGNVSVMVLGKIVKSYGGFDYCYTQSSRDESSFISTYVDYDRSFSENTNLKLGAVSYKPEVGLKEDQMELPSRKNNFIMLPAKIGYVFILEYKKKEKQIDLRLEKINF